MSLGRLREREFEKVRLANAHGYRIHCAQCSRTETIGNSKNTNLPTHLIVKKFTQRGWHVGRATGSDLCPAHAHQRKPKAAGPAGAAFALEQYQKIKSHLVAARNELEKLKGHHDELDEPHAVDLSDQLGVLRDLYVLVFSGGIDLAQIEAKPPLELRERPPMPEAEPAATEAAPVFDGTLVDQATRAIFGD